MTADVAFECRRKLNVPRRSARNTAGPLSHAGRMELPIEVRAHAEETIRRFCEARVPERSFPGEMLAAESSLSAPYGLRRVGQGPDPRQDGSFPPAVDQERDELHAERLGHAA